MEYYNKFITWLDGLTNIQRIFVLAAMALLGLMLTTVHLVGFIGVFFLIWVVYLVATKIKFPG